MLWVSGAGEKYKKFDFAFDCLCKTRGRVVGPSANVSKFSNGEKRVMCLCVKL